MAAGNSTKSSRKIGRPFEKGKSGNPSGRPKGASDLAIMIRTHAASRGPDRKVKLQTLIERLYAEDPKTYLAYGFGKPIEIHEVTGAGGKDLIPTEVIELGRKLAQSL